MLVKSRNAAPLSSPMSRLACSAMMLYSSAASASLRLSANTRLVSSSRSFTAYQRGESGRNNIPMSSAMAGTAAIPSM